MFRITEFFTAAFCVAFIAGCSQPDRVSAAATKPSPHNSHATLTQSRLVKAERLPKGWKRVEAVGENISIAYPQGWRAVDLYADRFRDSVRSAGRSNPSARSAALRTMELTRNRSVKLTVFHGPYVPGAFTPNVMVASFNLPSNVSFDQY